MKQIRIALRQYGTTEWGQGDNPEVMKYFEQIGFGPDTLKEYFNDETPWCSAFVNWVCMKANLEMSGKLNARSWLDVGEEVKKPRLGDVVVFWRITPDSSSGHVAFFIRELNDQIYVLGGNQRNMVSISTYPKERLLSYRRLKST